MPCHLAQDVDYVWCCGLAAPARSGEGVGVGWQACPRAHLYAYAVPVLFQCLPALSARQRSRPRTTRSLPPLHAPAARDHTRHLDHYPRSSGGAPATPAAIKTAAVKEEAAAAKDGGLRCETDGREQAERR